MVRITIGILMIFLASPCISFEFTGHRYAERQVEFRLGDLCDSARFPMTPGTCAGDSENPNWETEFVTALDRWNASTVFFEWFTDSGTGASTPGDCEVSDPNSAFFLDDVCGSAFGGSTLAVARTFFGADGNAVHSDIIYNTAKTWGAFDDSLVLHPGVADFRRVSVHEQGHVMGLAHPFHSDAIMYFASQEDIKDPQPDDLGALRALYGATTVILAEDFSGNGKQELVLLRSLDNGTTEAEVRDSGSGSLILSANILPATFSPINCAMLPDLDGDGNIEIATLAIRNSDNRAIVRIQNISGSPDVRVIWLPSASTAIKMIVVPDADSNNVEELAVLMTRDSDSRTFVAIRNAFGDQSPQKIFFLRFATPKDITLVSDADSNNVPEIAVLSSRFQDNRGVVEIKNASGAAQTNKVWVTSGFTALGVTSVDDADGNNVPEVAILSTRDSDGRILVEVQNAFGAADRNNLWFTSGLSPWALASVGDGDGNTIDEIAVLARRNSDGRVVAQIQNGAGAAQTQSLWYPPGFAPLRVLTITSDADGNGVPESSVLLSRYTDARLLIQQQNVSGAAETKNIWITP